MKYAVSFIWGKQRIFVVFIQWRIRHQQQPPQMFLSIAQSDCSYSNLELSFGKANGLFEIKERFETYIRFLNTEFAKHPRG